MTREPTEMELRVAKAMLASHESKLLAFPNGLELLLESLNPETRVSLFKQARAAIREMYTPTYAMKCSYRQMDTGAENWQHYIDAASPPE